MFYSSSAFFFLLLSNSVSISFFVDNISFCLSLHHTLILLVRLVVIVITQNMGNSQTFLGSEKQRTFFFLLCRLVYINIIYIRQKNRTMQWVNQQLYRKKTGCIDRCFSACIYIYIMQKEKKKHPVFFYQTYFIFSFPNVQ